MLTKVCTLIEALNTSRVRYCHWKSNAALKEALSGLTDLDLLIHRHDANAFRAVLAQCCFRPAGNPDGSSFPSTEHYFGLDSETGLLVHVHAYFRVITGESLAKNFRLPVEDMLLENIRQNGSIRVPTRATELVVFTIRMMLKHTSLVELALLARDWKSLRREIASLIDADSLDQSVQLVERWLPNVDIRLFAQCVWALHAPAPLMKRLILARRLRSSLRMYARRSRIRAWWTGLSTFALMLIRRLMRCPKGLVLRSGGALVAFVGPEATGKSTLITEASRWLGEHFAVERVHAGKPRSTLMTLLPNTIVPLLRIATPGQRPSELEARHATNDHDGRAPWVYPLTYAVRNVLLAYDRRVLLMRAFARAANGTIVLCDRYPYIARGAPDGPRLMHYPLPRDRYPIRNMLATLERRLYLQMPSPDLIISLNTPVEIAIARNRTRGKHEPEEYVRRRHSAAASIPVDKTLVCPINTNRQLDQTLRDVKCAIWNIL
jgi:thymidylate kinase